MTKTMVSWLFALAALVALPFSGVVRSQCVIVEKPEELFAAADAVFLGTVLRTEATGIQGSHVVVEFATFRVDRTWKGEAAMELRVGADSRFEKDKEYLVFAAGKPLTTTIQCRWTEPSERAKAKLDWLSKKEFAARAGSAEELEMAAAFRMVLTQLGGGGSMKFVAGSGLIGAARRALGLVRPMIDVGDVPGLAPTGAKGLPAGYFLVYSFAVTGNVAAFEGTAGPVPSGPSALNCGTGYKVELERAVDGWKIVKSYTIRC